MSSVADIVPLGVLEMVVVTIRCPQTGNHVSVGLEITAEAFKSLRPGMTRMRCPCCGSEHAWSKGIAWLSAEPLPPATPKVARQSVAVGRLEGKLTTHGVRARIERLEADRRTKFTRLLATWRKGPAKKPEASDAD